MGSGALPGLMLDLGLLKKNFGGFKISITYPIFFADHQAYLRAVLGHVR